MTGTLYVVATPIGNLEDLTLRASRVLGEVSLVVAEDTRHTRKLLSHLGFHKRMLSYNNHNAVQRTPHVLRAVLKADVALVSDAGVPLISDPGASLVKAAAEQGTPVVPIPGPSAVTAALAASGMSADEFHFLGFPSRARKARRISFESYSKRQETLVVFEAPHRLRAMLEDLYQVLGEREVVVCRELTKLHEEIFRGNVTEALEHFNTPRGEFVVVVAGAAEAMGIGVDSSAVSRALAQLKRAGATRRDAVEKVTQAYAISKRESYRLWLEL